MKENTKNKTKQGQEPKQWKEIERERKGKHREREMVKEEQRE